MEINLLVKKALTTGLNIAVFTGEKVHSVMGSVIEKSKELQERFQEELEEEEDEEYMENCEKAQSEVYDGFEGEENSEGYESTWQEYEHKMRNLVDLAVAKFNFIKRDDHKVIEKRIDALEEKLDHITELLAQQEATPEKHSIESEKI